MSTRDPWPLRPSPPIPRTMEDVQATIRWALLYQRREFVPGLARLARYIDEREP